MNAKEPPDSQGEARAGRFRWSRGSGDLVSVRASGTSARRRISLSPSRQQSPLPVMIGHVGDVRRDGPRGDTDYSRLTRSVSAITLRHRTATKGYSYIMTSSLNIWINISTMSTTITATAPNTAPAANTSAYLTGSLHLHNLGCRTLSRHRTSTCRPGPTVQTIRRTTGCRHPSRDIGTRFGRYLRNR